ncbi:unnamed protein product [Darwinula stevensoni]|uniref:E3 ubiquitin-protein ligase n=1 Tax=Darwinula stevensoni TaxID=69355 RepID=A0A7R8XIZ7_9CRUS|nr:unnamed protein product [Darwinula stevensoni]CAG0894790.1 unnamed protein product [Darwinula stevensoni]
MSKSDRRKISLDLNKKPSVFERLGTKPGGSTGVCRHWLSTSNCPFGKNCKNVNSHGSLNKSDLPPVEDLRSKVPRKSGATSPVAKVGSRPEWYNLLQLTVLQSSLATVRAKKEEATINTSASSSEDKKLHKSEMSSKERGLKDKEREKSLSRSRHGSSSKRDSLKAHKERTRSIGHSNSPSKRSKGSPPSTRRSPALKSRDLGESRIVKGSSGPRSPSRHLRDEGLRSHEKADRGSAKARSPSSRSGIPSTVPHYSERDRERAYPPESSRSKRGNSADSRDKDRYRSRDSVDHLNSSDRDRGRGDRERGEHWREDSSRKYLHRDSLPPPPLHPPLDDYRGYHPHADYPLDWEADRGAPASSYLDPPDYHPPPPHPYVDDLGPPVISHSHRWSPHHSRNAYDDRRGLSGDWMSPTPSAIPADWERERERGRVSSRRPASYRSSSHYKRDGSVEHRRSRDRKDSWVVPPVKQEDAREESDRKRVKDESGPSSSGADGWNNYSYSAPGWDQSKAEFPSSKRSGERDDRDVEPPYKAGKWDSEEATGLHHPDVSADVPSQLSDVSEDSNDILNRDEPEESSEQRCAETDVQTEESMGLEEGTEGETEKERTLDEMEEEVEEEEEDDEWKTIDFEEISEDGEAEFAERTADGTKPSIADALDIDWGSLISETKPKTIAPVSAMQRFTPKRILSQIGISAEGSGKALLDQAKNILSHVDSDDTEDEKLLDPMASLHSYKRQQEREKKSLFTDVGTFCRALTASHDLHLRRQLCGLPKAEVCTEGLLGCFMLHSSILHHNLCIFRARTCVHPVLLPCGHHFCFLCIKGATNQYKRCAICRQEIPQEYLDHPHLINNIDLHKDYAFEDGYQWFYEGRNGWWQYDERTSADLENAYKQGDRTCEVLIAGLFYVIDFNNMLQIRRNDPSRRRRIKRDLASIPKKGVAGLRIESSAEESLVEERGHRQTLSSDPLARGPSFSPIPVPPTNTPQTPHTPSTGSSSSSPQQQESMLMYLEQLRIQDEDEPVASTGEGMHQASSCVHQDFGSSPIRFRLQRPPRSHSHSRARSLSAPSLGPDELDEALVSLSLCPTSHL